MLFAIGFGIFFAVLITEIVMSAMWKRAYFAFGVPVFVRRAEKCRRLDDIPLEEVRRKSATAAAPPLAFKRLDPELIAFREGGIGAMHYAPIMRGTIRPDGAQPCVKVVAYLNWSVLVLAIVLIAFLGRNVVLIAPYFLGALALLYFIQAVRFNRVAKHIDA